MALRERMPVERASLAGLDATAAAARAAAVAANRTEDVVLLVNQPQSSPFEAAVQEAVLAVRPDAVVVYAGGPQRVMCARVGRCWRSGRRVRRRCTSLGCCPEAPETTHRSVARCFE